MTLHKISIGVIIVHLIIFFVYLVYIFYVPKQSASGTVSIDSSLNLTDYGFGPNKRLLIFDLTHIGSADKIHSTDKDFAILTWGEGGQFESQTVGIELKGDKRPKLNYAFEFWEPKDDTSPCVSVETCDDDKVELFDFGEKYEDYILNGGFIEPTFVRDAIVTKFHGSILEKRLVEVLFVIDGHYTYEGVYLLGPAIQRRVLEKTLGWDASGKKEDCDDEDYDPTKVGYILEYTTDRIGLFKSKECPIFKNNIKMRYPKCDFYDEAEIAPCRQAYIDETNRYIDKINGEDLSQLDLNSFVNTYLLEMFMRDGDFPYGSQYFHVNPDTGLLHSGPHWDYDRAYWKFIKHSWHLVDVYNSKTLPLWKKMGHSEEFAAAVRASRTIIQNNTHAALAIISERQDQLSKGYFDREKERWHSFGKRLTFKQNFRSLAYNFVTEDTFEAELHNIRKYFVKRSEWMLSHLDSFNGYDIRYYNLTGFAVLNMWPFWLSFIVMLSVVIYDVCWRQKRGKKLLPRI